MFRNHLAVVALLATSVGARGAAESFFEERVKDFGTVPRGPTLVHYFRVTNPTKGNVTISGVRVSCGCVTATVPVSRIGPGQSTTVNAQMDTRRFLGHKAVTVYVTFSEPYFEEVTLRVQAFSRDDFSISPDTLNAGTVRFGREASASVKLSFVGDPNWVVSDPVAESNYVKPTVKQVRKTGSEVAYELTATMRPDLPVGKWFTDVWVATNAPNMPKIRVPLSVEVTPAMTVSPNVLQFGQVKVGGKGEQKLIVRGDKPFKIVEVEGLDDGVNVSGKSDQAKAVHVLTFTYSPEKAGDLSKTVKVVTDGGDTELQVPVRATATEDE
jgi:hypothetical protein